MKVLVGLVLAALTGCGYHLAGTPTAVPESVRTVGIALFRNHTREYGLEVALRRALDDEFRRHGTLRVVPEDEADVVVHGDIRKLLSLPVGSAGADEVVQYTEVLRVGVRLVERATGHVLFENKLLQEAEDFGAERGVVVTSSPHFQRGLINGRDLANMTNVQLGPARRREALRELLDLLARDIYQQTMEGF